ncbi:MAG: hemolysin III family protein [Ruminococcaceae bacterium]|nr:hemolysin III family protein [Oscillospiraceae bacterium]
MDAVYNVSVVAGVRKRRTRLRDRALPSYTRGEEIFNMVTHIVGGGLGVVTLALCVVLAALSGNTAGVICGAIFGASMIILYTSSSIYHGLRTCMGKKVFQVLDHCTIYFLIAGTYTPMLICCLAKQHPINAYITLAVVWGLTALSITLTAIDMEKYKVFSMISYIGMGWAIIFSIKQMHEAIGNVGFALLLGGGVIYTVGTIFFKIGTKKRYFHSIFHIFVLLGSVTHALCVLLFAM